MPTTKLDQLLLFTKTFEANIYPTHSVDADGVCSCGREHDDNSAGKHPRFTDWKERASSDPEQIRLWHEEFPAANWGMSIPAHMVVIDCDVRQNGEEVYTARRPKGEVAPLTTVVETPTGGRHYYFRKPNALAEEQRDSISIKGSKKGHKYDILLNGHNVIIPPSIREGGKPYIFVGHLVPNLPELPEWAYATAAKGKRGRPRAFRFDPNNPGSLEMLEAALAALDPDDREVWVRVCIAVGRACAAEEGRGYTIVAAWAARSPKYNVRETRDLFFRESQQRAEGGPTITIEAIFKEAEAAGWARPENPTRRRDFDVIKIEGQLDETLIQTSIALAGHPNIYQRSHHLIYLGAVGNGYGMDDGANRPHHAPITQIVNKYMLPALLSERANYWQMNAKGESVLHDPPCELMAQFIVNEKFWSDRIPALHSFLDHPALTESGEIINSNGYHKESGLYIFNAGCANGELRNDLSQDGAINALEKVWQPFAEFPFEDEVDRAAFWASLFTIGVRHLFESVPVFAVMAPVAGTGKTKMINAISHLWLGRDPTTRTLPVSSEEEFEKIMPGLLLSGDRIINFDNIRAGSTVAGQRLETVLTSSNSAFRLMRENEATTIENRATFFLTGNQISFSTDMMRRVIPIRLNAHSARPHLRTGFRCNPPAFVAQNRGSLLATTLSIISSYLNRGAPILAQTAAEIGSFEHWFRVIRNLLLWLGLPDIATVSVKDDGDTTEYSTYAEIVAILRGLFPEDESRFKLTDIMAKCEGNKELRALFKGCAAHPTTSEIFYIIRQVMAEIRDKTFELDGRNVSIRNRLFGRNRERMWYFEETESNG